MLRLYLLFAFLASKQNQFALVTFLNTKGDQLWNGNLKMATAVIPGGTRRYEDYNDLCLEMQCH